MLVRQTNPQAAGTLFSLALLLSTLSACDVQPQASYPQISAVAETAPVPTDGDAADDPALWINRVNPQQSRVIGSNKKLGLHVYSLSGELLQTLAVGRINNVDVRQQVRVADHSMDIAVGSNRSDNSITVFSIDADGKLSESGRVATDLPEVYGFCLFQPKPELVFALINDKDGRYQQYRLDLNGKVSGQKVAEFKVDSQPEGCVADDSSGALYVGEEARGVWRLQGDEREGIIQADSAQLIARVGEHLVADVEGMGLYKSPQQSLLVVSSQGDDSYAVYDTQASHAYVGSFRIADGRDRANQAIDGSSETDGLEVSAAHLGGDFTQGILIVQDGDNQLPQAGQNFKLVAWKDVASLLSPQPSL